MKRAPDPIAPRHRGQPLATLVVLLVGWVAIRAMSWEPPFVKADIVRMMGPSSRAQALDTAATALASVITPHTHPGSPSSQALLGPAPAPPVFRFRFDDKPAIVSPDGGLVRSTTALLPVPATSETEPEPHTRNASGGDSPSAEPARDPMRLPVRFAKQVERRWSGDSWLLYRANSRDAAAAVVLPRYGASQLGGVVRFALAPQKALAPQAYVRASRALQSPAQSEAALGLSARPVASLPLRVMAEGRLRGGSGSGQLRPAALAVTELPPISLPLGGQGEIYAQAGYLGGRGATPFFDAQAVAERRLTGAGPAEFWVGAGAWAGGQRGASRLDLGPRAVLRLSAGPAAARIAVDWRFRVAGHARPSSGPAVTFSAGF